MDVSNAGCNYIYYNKCCGIYPRWNWILGGCETDMPPSDPGFACTADMQKNSAYDIYYISAYQWDGNKWVLDPTSSISGNGGLINGQSAFANMKIDGTDSPNPKGGDWQAKWTPRTATTQTKGLGPPGFMFVLSAKKLQWMTFYALPQKTINRGPEGQFIPSGYDNCWYAELDFLEAPFWGPSKTCYMSSYPNAAYFSSGAQFGGCFPMGTNIGDDFASECTTQWCCEATRCAAGFKAFIDPNSYGTTVAGCAGSSTPNPPPGQTWCGLVGNPQKCADFRALGGCGSSSFFDNDPNTEYMFAFVVDRTGVFGYRWIANSEDQANAFWPGIYKYNSSSVLLANRPATRPQMVTNPCAPSDPSCIIFHPTSTGDRPCVTAAGDINYLGHMGVAAAGGSNWWDLFDDTQQWWGYDSSITPTSFP
eukprot:TRINITY_DN8722_c0_g1_i1.p1 TRINITY_DN8722_c0_g1~~TRINITY_DN8722_c0_g1_i1.p1  ORF type:complete len:479 (-),score=92.62 TRINITY_DN8722_c0_g1_i1:35-1297(-)